jgi:uncharacterized protein
VRIGILSDTHGLLRPEVFPALEGVDHILHAGDVGDPDLLLALEALAPVTAVHGNTDGWEVRGRVPESAEVALGGLRFALVHGHLPRHGTTPERLSAAFPDADVVVFGHTHQPFLKEEPGAGGCPRWFLNPGSAGPRRFRLPVTLVRAEVHEGTLRVDWIHLAPMES